MQQPRTPSPRDEHHLEWDDRLLDWLDSRDGGANDEQAAAFEAHLHTCKTCQQRVEAFSRLDDALIAANPAPTLSASFDARLFERIGSMSEEQRAAARQRIDAELQDNLRALSRTWRRSLAFAAAGVIGGVALALALAGELHSAGVTGRIAAEGATQFGSDAGAMQVALIGLLGAAIGGFVSTWVARATD